MKVLISTGKYDSVDTAISEEALLHFKMQKEDRSPTLKREIESVDDAIRLLKGITIDTSLTGSKGEKGRQLNKFKLELIATHMTKKENLENADAAFDFPSVDAVDTHAEDRRKETRKKQGRWKKMWGKWFPPPLVEFTDLLAAHTDERKKKKEATTASGATTASRATTASGAAAAGGAGSSAADPPGKERASDPPGKERERYARSQVIERYTHDFFDTELSVKDVFFNTDTINEFYYEYVRGCLIMIGCWFGF
jgi:hypothetical protein